MTDTMQRPATAAAPPDIERPARRLRAVLAANAATSLLFGVAGLVAAPYWAETLGIDSTGWIRLVSAGLVLFAVDVGFVAARARASLAAAAMAVSLADLAWVAATGVALATIDFTTAGWMLAVAIAAGVVDFALLQLWFRSRLAH